MRDNDSAIAGSRLRPYFDEGGITIYCGDCREILPTLPPVDLVVTSPPYDNLRAYKGYSFDFEGVAREIYRVVAPGGVAVWVVGDATVNGSETGTSWKQALFFREIGFNIHDTMLYHKANYVPLTHRRYEQCWEYMFCFSKGVPRAFNPLRVPCQQPGRVRRKQIGMFDPRTQKFDTRHTYNPTPETKIAPNLFSYIVGNENTGHPAVYPVALAYDQISSWSNPNDIALDPFMGSGTTLVAAKQLGRRCIGIDISREYCDMAVRRLRQLDIDLTAMESQPIAQVPA